MQNKILVLFIIYVFLLFPNVHKRFLQNVTNDNSDELNKLLLIIEDVDFKDAKGRTPLIHAARAGAINTLTALIFSGASIDAKDESGRTAMFYAAQSGRADLLSVLYAAGGDARGQDEHGRSPLSAAVSNGKPELLAALGKSAAEYIKGRIEGGGLSAGDYALFIRSAELNPAIEFSLPKGMLIRMIESGEKEAARILIERGADVNVYDEYQNSALLCAVRNSMPDIAKLLLIEGARPEKANVYGESALLYALRVNSPVAGELIDYAQDVNVKDENGETALHFAAAAAEERLLRKLLLKGANPNVSNDYGYTPLMYAVESASIKCVRTLLRAGADKGRRDIYGSTAYERARLLGEERLMRMLEVKREDT